MTITIKTKNWTVVVNDAESKQDWTYRVLRGAPTLRQIWYALRHIAK